MARTDYGPEIKKAIASRSPSAQKKPPPKESPADQARDKQRGIPEGSAQDARLDAMPQNQMRAGPPQMAGPPQPQPQPPQQGLSPHHITAAAGIAHSILNSRGGY
jgi:hypothetical protein